MLRKAIEHSQKSLGKLKPLSLQMVMVKNATGIGPVASAQELSGSIDAVLFKTC